MIIVELHVSNRHGWTKLTAKEECGPRRRRGRGNATKERPLKVAPFDPIDDDETIETAPLGLGCDRQGERVQTIIERSRLVYGHHRRMDENG